MPTYESDERFRREYQRLAPEQRAAFHAAVAKLVADLRRGAFRKGLRIKRYEGGVDTWEMTWADNGRALFRYGPSIRPGDPHVVWLRIGGHEIFDER
jgi:hypothetical protein